MDYFDSLSLSPSRFRRSRVMVVSFEWGGKKKKKKEKNWPLTTSHKALIVYCSENSNANELNEGENGIAAPQLMQCGDLLRFMNEINEVSV